MNRDIKAILFDLDDTLMVEMACERASFLTACELAEKRRKVDVEELYDAIFRRARELWEGSKDFQFCEKIGFAFFEGLWSTFEGNAPAMKRLRRWAPTYRRKAWRLALKDAGVEDDALADALSERYQRERRKRHVLFDETLGALEDLRADYRLGILTNGAEDIQRSKIDGAGLSEYFDTIVITGALGVGKPHPRSYMAALEALSAGPAETAMVGNNLERDIQGAKKAGLFTVWLNRGDAVRHDNIRPDVEIRHLTDIREALTPVE